MVSSLTGVSPNPSATDCSRLTSGKSHNGPTKLLRQPALGYRMLDSDLCREHHNDWGDEPRFPVPARELPLWYYGVAVYASRLQQNLPTASRPGAVHDCIEVSDTSMDVQQLR